MNKEEALQFIKQALNEATAQGAFKTLDYTYAVVSAFNVIAEELNKKEDKNDKKIN